MGKIVVNFLNLSVKLDVKSHGNGGGEQDETERIELSLTWIYRC